MAHFKFCFGKMSFDRLNIFTPFTPNNQTVKVDKHLASLVAVEELTCMEVMLAQE